MAAFDGQYYQAVAKYGYHSLELIAFYPFYPLLVNFFSKIFVSFYVSGVFVSWIAAFLGLFYLYKLYRLDNSEKISLRSIFYFLIYPSAVIYAAIYSESLFLLFVVTSFYAARKQKWLVASILGFFAALTRMQGAILFPVLLVEYFLEKENRKKKLAKKALDLICLLLIPFATFLFFNYARTRLGDFWLPISSHFGYQRLSPSLGNIYLVLKNIVNVFQLPFFDYHISVFDLITIYFFIVSLFIMIRQKMRPSYLLYAALIIFIPLSSGVTTSMTRVLSASFPHFLFFRSSWRKKQNLSI